MARVVVYHGSYGCDTGCCGHWIEVENGETKFTFDHPYDGDHLEFAKKLIEEEFGKDHCHDLDWKRCEIGEW